MANVTPMYALMLSLAYERKSDRSWYWGTHCQVACSQIRCHKKNGNLKEEMFALSVFLCLASCFVLLFRWAKIL